MQLFSQDRTHSALVTFYTLAAGGIGAWLGHVIGMPAYVLAGPALFISLLNVFPVRFGVDCLVRDAAFLLIGIAIGSGVDATAVDAFVKWPVAFLILVVVLFVTLRVSSMVLGRVFGFEARAAVLAATPGHLSFVIATGAALKLDVARVACVQAVRLLSLTLAVPFVALAFGVEVDADLVPGGSTMPIFQFFALLVSAFVVSRIFLHLQVPAAILIAGLVVSVFAHLTGVVSGVIYQPLALLCFVTVGALIGTRFSGIAFAQLRRALFAGLLTTFLAVGLAALAAMLVSWLVGMPSTQVLVAFAPGGLETMVAMGAMLGANPGFVVACHVGRLLLLSILVPVLLARYKDVSSDQ